MRFKVRTIDPIPSDAYPTAAQRPKNSRLCLDKLEKRFQIHLPHWKDGLQSTMSEFLRIRGSSGSADATHKV